MNCSNPKCVKELTTQEIATYRDRCENCWINNAPGTIKPKTQKVTKNTAKNLERHGSGDRN